MGSHDRLTDLMVAYISGNIGEQERQELMKELDRNPELKQELDELSDISAGIEILQSMSEGHIESDVLVSYCENRNLLDNHTLAEIKEHIAVCQQCANEVEMCQESFRRVDNIKEGTSSSIIKRLVSILLPARFTLHPVVIYSAIALFVTVSYYGLEQRPENTSHAAVYDLNASIQRGSNELSEVTIAEDQSAVTLRMMLPTRERHLYEIELLDSNNRIVVTFNNVLHQLPIAIAIPTQYLSDGEYRLKVTEAIGAGESSFIPVEIAFRVKFAN